MSNIITADERAALLADNPMQSTLTPPEQITPLVLMDKAVSMGQDVTVLKELVSLREQMERYDAEKAFAAAISRFQTTCPTIIKRKEMRVGSGSTLYAPLGDIMEQIRDTLRDCELSIRHRVSEEAGVIRVTCIVSHALGHSEEVTMTGGPDSSGSKNPIQQIGSTVSYLRRYTTEAALGLVTADMDMDGRVMQDFITADQRADLVKRAKAANVNMEKYLAYLKVATLDELRAVDYAKAEQAMKDQEKAHAARKAKAAKTNQEGKA